MAILDAAIRHTLTDPGLQDSREFYGTRGDKKVALVLFNDRMSWPDWYRPAVDGYDLTRVDGDMNVDPGSPRLLGIRLDKFNLTEKANQLFDGQIEIVMFNAGGDGGGESVIGGCTVYYGVKRDGDKWAVECNGWLDP